MLQIATRSFATAAARCQPATASALQNLTGSHSILSTSFPVQPAQLHHEGEIRAFLLEHYREAESTQNSLGITVQDVKTAYKKTLQACLQDGNHSMLAMDPLTGKILGTCIAEVHSADAMPPHCLLKFPPEVLEADTMQKMSKLERFYEELLRALQKSTDAQSLIRVNMISTDPYFFRKSIGGAMLEAMLTSARLSGVELCYAAATTVAGQKLFTRHGFRTAREIFFTTYKDENGRKVFRRLHDCVLSGKLMIREL